MNEKRIIKAIIFSPLILLFVFWTFSIIKCECLTLIYGHLFEEHYEISSVVGEIEKFRILKLDNEEAEVYYIVNNGLEGIEKNEVGMTATFFKTNNIWVYEGYNTVWSKQGNADSFIWPYGRKIWF